MPELDVRVDPNPVAVDDEFTVAFSSPPLQRTTATRAEFVLAIDASPSMTWPAQGEGQSGPTRWDLARDGANALLGSIADDAQVHVVLFGDDARHLDTGTAAELRPRLARALPARPPEEYKGTNIEAGLRESYRRLAASTATSRVVLLLSDGEPTMGRTRPDDLAAISAEATGQDIYTRSIGFGVGVNIDLLKLLASNGDPCHVRSAASTSGTVAAIMSQFGAAGQGAVAAGGTFEAVVSPHFAVLGVYQLTPAKRKLARAARTQPDGATAVSFATGSIGAGDDRPVYAVRLRAPSRSSSAPIPLLRLGGTVRMAGGSTDLVEKTVTVQLTAGAGGDMDGEALDIMNSVDLAEEIERQIESAPQEHHERIYRDGLERAKRDGFREQVDAFSAALRQLTAGEDARDVRNEFTATSSRSATQARSLLMLVQTVPPTVRADGPRPRPPLDDEEDDDEPAYRAAPTTPRRTSL